MLLMVDAGDPRERAGILSAPSRAGAVCLASCCSARVRGGEPRSKSDIDLAVFGGDQVRFTLDVEEEAPTLLSFDFVNMDDGFPRSWRPAWRRKAWCSMKKYDNYAAQLAVLERAKDEDLSNEFVMSGVTNKFALQFELAWKLLKETLAYEGVAAAASGSPRENLGRLPPGVHRRRSVARNAEDPQRPLAYLRWGCRPRHGRPHRRGVYSGVQGSESRFGRTL